MSVAGGGGAAAAAPARRLAQGLRFSPPSRRAGRAWRGALFGLAMLAASGCSTLGEGAGRLGDGVGYYWQSIMGHLALMGRAEAVDSLLAKPELEARTRERLLVSRTIRRFAVTELGLPDNGSYARFVQLDRPFVTWGVVAAPELSLTLNRWCFPVAGCVSYRGYFAEAEAEAYAKGLTERGLDVAVNGVPAYSTLGWFDDPLLSTFIQYPDADLARLVFHELAHQVVYVKGDSTFNESFATAVELLGVERWLDRHGTAGDRASWQQRRARQADFHALLSRYRARLAELYASALTDDQKRAGKVAVFDALRADYQVLKNGAWQGFAGYDRWFNRPLGNAHLGAIATYSAWVPAFLTLFNDSGQDFGRFYEQVQALADLSIEARTARLRHLAGSAPVLLQ